MVGDSGDTGKVVKIPSITNEQIQARDDIADYIRRRLEPMAENRIKNFLKRAMAGEIESVDKVVWEWTITIEGKELDDLKELVRKMLGSGE
jgi:hypothetical protein